jgi:large subunit ribosomal protein L1
LYIEYLWEGNSPDHHKETRIMPTKGKRYIEVAKLVEPLREYLIADAIPLVKETAKAKFDETIELHFRLGIDPRQSDQQVRSTVLMPYGLGKTVRVLIFADGEDARIAQEAGADIIASDEIIEKIQKEGWTDFDAALATQSMMPRVGRLGRVLGPRGLMPSPKANTVVTSDQIAKAIQELKAGRVEFRNDKSGNLHMPVGKASFTVEALLGNAVAAIEAVNTVRPSGVKGRYVRRITLASTMGPAIRIEQVKAVIE